MKELDYFVEFEQKYSASPIPDMVWIDGDGFQPAEEPLHFLRKGRFLQLSSKAKELNGKCGLSDVEWMILLCFMADISYSFRDDCYYNGTPNVVKEMQIILDSVINKAPRFNGEKLYRFLNYNDKVDFEIGDIYMPSHSLTTTNEDWGKDRDVYEIIPLHSPKTKAHSLFCFYNHGEENQVNFERGAKFVVTDIQMIREFKRIYLSEIE